MTFENQNAIIKVSDGTEMQAYFEAPELGTKYPVILVCQEIFGVNSYIRSIVDRFVQKGFAAIAPDLFHRTAPGFQSSYEDLTPGRAEAQKMTLQGIEADFKGVYDWLSQKNELNIQNFFSIGFCMGGRVAFLSSTILPLRGAISFYGTGIHPTYTARVANVKCPLLFFWGEQDKSIPRDQRIPLLENLQKHQKVYISVDFSEAGHGFFCDERGSFHAPSAQLAWTLTLDFLTQHVTQR